MPLYEYECAKCEKVHEIMQKFSDVPMETCPECGSPVKKLISMSSFSLKGSGWYTTDYKRAGKAPGIPAASATGEAKPKSDASGPTASPAPEVPSTPTSPPKSSETKTGS